MSIAHFLAGCKAPITGGSAHNAAFQVMLLEYLLITGAAIALVGNCPNLCCLWLHVGSVSSSYVPELIAGGETVIATARGGTRKLVDWISF